jgi:hypothetical protein
MPTTSKMFMVHLKKDGMCRFLVPATTVPLKFLKIRQTTSIHVETTSLEFLKIRVTTTSTLLVEKVSLEFLKTRVTPSILIEKTSSLASLIKLVGYKRRQHQPIKYTLFSFAPANSPGSLIRFRHVVL